MKILTQGKQKEVTLQGTVLGVATRVSDGTSYIHCENDGNEIVLGEYQNTERSQKVIEMIHDHFISNKNNTTFQMPHDNEVVV